ncbi:MAG: general secretion pathway protein GspB [Desulfobacula sp.]|nr:general secretion pathway protein GspB [Desulfobacula sp.]
MSTILKALKKAEQESPEQENKNRSSLKLNIRTTLNSRIQHQRQGFFLSAKGLILVLGSALVMALAAYVLFSPARTIQSTPPRPAQHQSPCITPVEKNASQTPSQPPIKNLPPPSESLAENITVHKAESLPPVIEKTPMQQEQNIKEKGSVPVLLPVSKPGPREEEIFPLKDGMLTIQAISWAKNPSDRIAVINTKIVGEGESVQGYRILEIAQDEVIFELSGRKFRLPFTYR